jgi:hypothetical protein
MRRVWSLRVSESKRLVARGVTEADYIKSAMRQAAVAPLPGIPNGHIIEEATGKPFCYVSCFRLRRRQARVLIGYPTGGNAGIAFGAAVSPRVRYPLAEGLDKSVHGDLTELARLIHYDPIGP